MAPDPGVAEFEKKQSRTRGVLWCAAGSLASASVNSGSSRAGTAWAASPSGTLAQIGRELGISKQRVSQIAARAESKLRKIARRETLEALEI